MNLKCALLLTAAWSAIPAATLTYGCPKCEAVSDAAPAALFADVTALHHPISTSNPLAQQYFDQGLTLVFAFNHDEAIRSFKKAAELDPNCAMAWWGVALALGPNYNIDVTPETELAAFEAIQKALNLRQHVSPRERDYIDSLAVRYTAEKDGDLKALAVRYVESMKALSAKYPDDTDAATMYAESLMLLRPWRLWDVDGTAAEGTKELVAVLEDVLRRDPDHVGANHLYIHAVEASPQPEKALPSADRLPGLSPGSGHLVHMPSHIYQRVGDYNASATTNEAAIAVDDEYFQSRPRNGMYRMMYYNHNVHFAAVAHAWQGNGADARRWAKKLHAEVLPLIAELPPLEQFATIEGLTELQFCNWDNLLTMPEPAQGLQITRALWHFGRGMALAARTDLPAARYEQKRFAELSSAIPLESPYGMLNTASDALGIARRVLDARIAESEGRIDVAVEAMNNAVAIQDRLIYDEPPPWPIPLRQNLGGILLRAGRYAEAERAFRADLQRFPRHGRSLFGLMQSLRGQGREQDAGLVEQQFQRAWKHADMKLSIESL